MGTDEIRFCMLNEFLYQNGVMELNCSVRSRSRVPYIAGMSSHALRTPLDALSEGAQRGSRRSGNKRVIYHPLVLHLNHLVEAEEKPAILEGKGLWLYKSEDQRMYKRVCGILDLSVTPYAATITPIPTTTAIGEGVGKGVGIGKGVGLPGLPPKPPPNIAPKNWTSMVVQARAELHQTLSSTNQGDSESTCISFSYLPPHLQSAYAWVNGSFRVIPDRGAESCSRVIDDEAYMVAPFEEF